MCVQKVIERQGIFSVQSVKSLNPKSSVIKSILPTRVSYRNSRIVL